MSDMGRRLNLVESKRKLQLQCSMLRFAGVLLCDDTLGGSVRVMTHSNCVLKQQLQSAGAAETSVTSAFKGFTSCWVLVSLRAHISEVSCNYLVFHLTWKLFLSGNPEVG